MTEVRYIGMTFVYPEERDRWELIKSKDKIIEILVRKYECVGGYYVSKIGGVYLEGDKVMGWRYRKDPEYDGIPYFLNEEEYEIVWMENMEKGIEEVRKYEHWERIGKRIESVAFKSFPPKRYLDKHKVVYDRDKPAFPMGQLEGPEIWLYTPDLWYTYKGNKNFITLDFGTYERYFYSEDEKLNRAVEEFLVDLMREIVMATEPEYGYMDMNEYRPLERDPVCDDMKEMKRYPSEYGEGMYVRLGQIAYLRKEIIESEVGKNLEAVYHPYYEDRYRINVEDMGKYYLMYGENFVYTKNCPVYRCLDRDREYGVLKALYEDEVIIRRVCGDIDNGLVMEVTSNKTEDRKKIKEKVEKWSRRYRVKIRDIKIL